MEFSRPYTVGDVTHPGVYISDLEKSNGRHLVAMIDPGGYTIPHTHTGTETVYVIDGEGTLVLGAQEIEMTRGTTHVIPAHVRHSIRNRLQKALILTAEFDPPFQKQITRFGIGEFHG